MPFTAALSEHPIPAYATGEVCGAALEAVGTHPDLVVLFTTSAHAGALEDILAAVESVLHPSVVVAAASEAIVATGHEVEQGPAISLWAGRWGPVLPVRLTFSSDGVAGLPSQVPFEPGALMLIGDPYSTPTDVLVETVEARFPGLPIVGGMAWGARGPGGSRIGLGAQVHTDGAVGALIGPGVDVTTVVSQGCRPIGRPYTVTDGDGQIIRTLGGKAALARLDELATKLTPDEIRAVNGGGLFLGRVVDEHKEDFETGDFLVHNVIGGDRETGAIAVNDLVSVGMTVQFHIRDAQAAHDDLDRLLGRVAPDEIDAALLFTCNGRGSRLFGEPSHDAGMVASYLGPVPTAGLFAAGELGPLGGHNELHSFTASMLLFSEHQGLGMVTP